MSDNAPLEPVPVAAHDGILALFQAAPVVALGEAHWLDQQHRLIRKLLLDKRFAETLMPSSSSLGTLFISRSSTATSPERTSHRASFAGFGASASAAG
jgi:hypothetical protein